jgi:DNA-binding NarL/FixJ family response regulator
MNNLERRQQRIIVGWSLDRPQGSLAGYPIDRAVTQLQEQLFELVARGEFGRLAPEGSTDAEVKKRMIRVEQALAGTSFRAIAEEEGVEPGTVRESIKDTMRRLKIIGYKDY